MAAIGVADGAVRIDGLDGELKKALFWGAPVEEEHREDFIEHVKGWWLGVAVGLLTGGLEAFSAIDMVREIADIRDQYGPENLPTDPELPDPDAEDVSEYEERVFVKQLALIPPPTVNSPTRSAIATGPLPSAPAGSVAT